MKIPVNLENYPNLLALAEADKEEFLQFFKALFTMADHAAKHKHLEASKDFFGMPYHEFMTEVMEAMFDHAGIMKYHPVKIMGEALSDMYGHAVNPLHAAFQEVDLMDAEGNKVSFESKFALKEEEFDVKSWLHGLMFYSYYCSLPDLARYLALQDYTLVDEEKHKNIAKLVQIRPALNYQKRIGILPGKLIPETGFFEAGDYKEGDCPACQVPDTLRTLGKITFCSHCYAGYINE